ncbi:tryptophan 7-halogenase [Tistrella bauzanensis]|uniref:tryptophan 7-halogenase n=1 Tax=Tistrella TaxID=171436 RepID=UPI0031F68CFA
MDDSRLDDHLTAPRDHADTATPATRADVLVAGAGPAGAVAAHALARAGLSVEMADRVQTAPKIGEALPGAALRLLRAEGLPVPSDAAGHRPVRGNWSAWSTPDLVASDFLRSPDGPGWRLDRLIFDDDLRRAAMSAGAGFRRAAVRDLIRLDDGDWGVAFSDGGPPLKARWLVDATGRRAAIARRLGAARLRDRQLIALYGRFNAIAGAMSDPGFDRTVIEAVPDGWWYAARMPSGAVLASLHTTAPVAARMLADPSLWHQARLATRHLSALTGHAGAAEALAAPVGCDAGGARLDSVAGDGWLAIGDAAQAFDPLSAQGLLSAMHGALTGAAAVVAALGGDQGGLDRYRAGQDEVRRIYLDRLASHYRGAAHRFQGGFWDGL